MHIRSIVSLVSFALAFVFVGPSFAAAQSQPFRVLNDGGSRVQFVSDAPLETITGVTSGLSGDLSFDPANIATLRGTVRVSIASLRTGVDLRDEHLRGSSWLDATRFPETTFTITAVEGTGAVAPGEARDVTVRGRLSLHGVTRDVSASVRLRRVAPSADVAAAPGVTGEVIRVRATFSLRLTDFGVSVPSPVRLKVSNEIELNVDLRAVS